MPEGILIKGVTGHDDKVWLQPIDCINYFVELFPIHIAPGMDIAEQYCLYLRSLVLAAGSNGYRILFHKDLSGMDKSIGRQNSSQQQWNEV